MWYQDNTQFEMTEQDFDNARNSFFERRKVRYKRFYDWEEGFKGQRALRAQYFISGDEEGTYMLNFEQQGRAINETQKVIIDLDIFVADGHRGGTESLLDEIRTAFQTGPAREEAAR